MDKLYDTEEMSTEQVEQTAHQQGWRNEEEFKGNPDQWTPADTFLNKLNDSVPMMRSQFRKLEKTNAAQSDKISGMETAMNKFMDNQDRIQLEAEERGRKSALNENQTKMVQAIEDGDSSQVTRLQSEADDLRQPAKQEQPAQPQPNLNDSIAVEMFKRDNGEALKNQEFYNEINDSIVMQRNRNPDIGMTEALEIAKNRAVKLFGEEEKAPRVNPVMNGAATSNKVKSGFSDIPADNRDVYEAQWRVREKYLRVELNKTPEQIKKDRKSFENNCIAIG